jgi:hypothetical protein
MDLSEILGTGESDKQEEIIKALVAFAKTPLKGVVILHSGAGITLQPIGGSMEVDMVHELLYAAGSYLRQVERQAKQNQGEKESSGESQHIVSEQNTE